jgi:hypothetical protein
MRLATINLFVSALLIICALVISGCSSQPANQPAPAPTGFPAASPTLNATNVPSVPSPSPNPSVAAKPKFDACTLLTSDEIKAVQGEPIQETKLSDRTTGQFMVTQCYYALPTQVNSVSLSITERNPANQGGPNLKEFWEETFGKDENRSERERKRERKEEKSKQRALPEGEEEEGAPPEPVRGVGDEAFWTASRIGGALYVLKRDRFIRISVGGKGDAEAKLKKSKTLARNVLRRL